MTEAGESQNYHERWPGEFRYRLDDIVRQQITPENIDTYANDALLDTINLVNDTVSAFQAKNVSAGYAPGREQETAAFEHYGLTEIEDVLDHIHSVASELDDIDQIIDNAEANSRVYVPPGQNNRRTSSNEHGTYSENGQSSRLKSVLYAVSHFRPGTDIHDPEQVQVSTGAVTDSMKRTLPYSLVDIPAYRQAVLVCDEGSNITFVLNTQIMAAIGTTPEEIAVLPKSEITDRIHYNPDLGSRVVYSSVNYIPRISNALYGRTGFRYGLIDRVAYDAFHAQGYSGIDDIESFAPPPEGHIKAEQIARTYDLDPGTIDGVISSLEGELGQVVIARNGQHGIARFLSSEQVAIITRRLTGVGFSPSGRHTSTWQP